MLQISFVIYARKLSRGKLCYGSTFQSIKTNLIEKYGGVPMTSARGECDKSLIDSVTFHITDPNFHHSIFHYHKHY